MAPCKSWPALNNASGRPWCIVEVLAKLLGVTIKISVSSVPRLKGEGISQHVLNAKT
jgi:hypothetical protein